MATRDVYTLTYNPFLGHVSLLREHDTMRDPALLGVDAPASASASESGREAERAAHKSTRAVGAAVSRGRDGADWFTRRPGTASAHGRGLAL